MPAGLPAAALPMPPLPAPEAGTAAARCPPGGGSLRGRAQSAMSGPGRQEEEEAAVRWRLLPSQLRPCGAEPPPHGPRRHCLRLRAGRRRRGRECGVRRAGPFAVLWGPAELSRRSAPPRRVVAGPCPLQALSYPAPCSQTQNYGMASVGRDLKDHESPIPLPHAGPPASPFNTRQAAQGAIQSGLEHL